MWFPGRGQLCLTPCSLSNRNRKPPSARASFTAETCKPHQVMVWTLGRDEIAFSLTAPQLGLALACMALYISYSVSSNCGVFWVFLGCKHLQPKCEVSPSAAVELCQLTPHQILLLRVHSAVKNWVSYSNPERAIYSLSLMGKSTARGRQSRAADPKQNTSFPALGKRTFWDETSLKILIHLDKLRENYNLYFPDTWGQLSRLRTPK